MSLSEKKMEKKMGSALESGKLKGIPNETSGPGRDKPAPGHRLSRVIAGKERDERGENPGTDRGVRSFRQ
jgi:hypothetical protein